MGSCMSKDPPIQDKEEYEHWLSRVNEKGEDLRYAPEELRRNKKIVLAAVQEKRYGHFALKYASPELQNDKKIVMAAVQSCGWALEHAPDQLRNEKRIVLAAVQSQGSAYEFASKDLQNDKDIQDAVVPYWLVRLERDGQSISDAPEHVRNSRKIVMTAVNEHGGALRYVTPELQSDKEIVMAAVQSYGWVLKYAAPELRADREVVIAALQAKKLGHEAIEFIDPELLQNSNDTDLQQHIWLAKGKGDWKEFENSPEQLRGSKHFMLAAIEASKKAMQFSSSELRRNKEFILEAAQLDGNAIQYALPEFQNDKEVVMAAVQQTGYALRHVSPDCANDREIVMTAVQGTGWALQHASPGLRNEKEIVIAAVRNRGDALEYAPPNLQNDKEIVLEAVQQDGMSLEYASPDLRNDTAVVVAAIKKSYRGTAIEYASPEIQSSNKEVAVAYVRSWPDNIKNVPEDFKRDRDVLVAAGMYDEDHDDANARQEQRMTTKGRTKGKTTNCDKKIILSTRFSLNASSSSEATNFTKLLKDNEYIRSKFIVYAPNAFDKKTCDPNWTDFDHPCRGTKDTCQYDNIRNKDGNPTDDCCWRYSYRHQLEEAETTVGFMLQLVESGEDKGREASQSLGKGQTIERDMAQELKMKVFHIYRPTYNGWENPFNKFHIQNEVVPAIKAWYDGGCQDMSESVVRCFMGLTRAKN